MTNNVMPEKIVFSGKVELGKAVIESKWLDKHIWIMLVRDYIKSRLRKSFLT